MYAKVMHWWLLKFAVETELDKEWRNAVNKDFGGMEILLQFWLV